MNCLFSITVLFKLLFSAEAEATSLIAPANLICFSEKENFFEENILYYCRILITSMLCGVY